MGHISIVTQKSFKDVIKTGHVSVSAYFEGKYKMKTISDQFADLLNVKIGDKIFFWVIADKVNKTKNLGFLGYAIATGNAIFVKSELLPYKIPVGELHLYDTPLSERQALSLNQPKKLWNLIGKKSLRRGRGLIHQTPFEDEILLKLLNENSTSRKEQIFQKKFESEFITISLCNSQITVEEFNNKKIELVSCSMDYFPFTRENFFSYEKTLEAYIVETFRDNKYQKILQILGLESFSVEWVGNYLAYGVLGGNIDVLVLLKKEGRYLLVVLELKNEKLNQEKTKDVISQIDDYSIEMRETFETFVEGIGIKKVVIAPSFCEISPKTDVNFLKYSIIDNNFVIE